MEPNLSAVPASPARRSIALLYCMSFLQGMCFYGPVATLYRTEVGVTMGQISLIEAVTYLLVVMLEVPLGAVCARIGYRRMLMASSALFFISKIVFWQAYTFGAFLAERVILAFVLAGLSGCDDAYLYLCAGRAGAQRVLGLYGAAGTAGLLAASALFSLFLADDYRLAALWTVATYGLAALLACFLAPVPAGEEDAASLRAQLAGIVRNLRANPRFAGVLSADALLSITGQTVTVFLSQLLYVRLGLPAAVLGVLYIGMTLAGLCGAWSHRLCRALGRAFGPTLCLVGAAGCLAAGFSPWPALCVAGVFTLQIVWRLWQPYAARLKNDNVTDAGGARSVVLSGYSMAVTLGSSALGLVLGGLADAHLTAALALAAALCLAAAGLLRLFGPRA